MRWPLARRPASRTNRAGSQGRVAAPALALLLNGCAAKPVDLDGPMGPPPPIPVAPHDGEVVSTARPTFRWKLVRGEDTAELTLCRSALCRDVLDVVRVSGSEWTPDHDLPSGLLYYRLRGGVGTRLGTESTLENRVAVEGKVALEGKHAALIIAWDRRQFGERLLSVAERGIDFLHQPELPRGLRSAAGARRGAAAGGHASLSPVPHVRATSPQVAASKRTMPGRVTRARLAGHRRHR